MCSAMSQKPEPQASQPPAVRAEVARMQAGAAPQPPSPASSATSADVSSPSSPESPETVRKEGPGATGRQRGEGAVVGKGEGGDKRGQAEAGRGRAEGVAAGAEGQGEGQGQRAAEGPGADPFNVVDVRAGMDMRRREWKSQRESVVADILEVSEDEGEGAGRMAVEGGPGQPSAPNVMAAAMKSILPEVRRQEQGKGSRGQLEAGAAGSGEKQRKCRRERADGQGRERAGRDVGGCARKGTPGRKGVKREWMGATVAAAPTLVQAVAAEVAPTGQCGRKGGGGEGGAPPAGGAVRGAGARAAPALSPPAPGAGTGHHLPVRDGAGEDGDEGGAGGAEQRSGAGQWCGTGRRRQGQAGERSEATRATGEETGEGGTPRSRRQGTRGDGATRQGAGEGEWPWVHGLAGVHREWWGGVVPPAVPPIVPPFPPPPYPAMGMVYPPLPAYLGMQPQAHMQQHQQAGGTAWGAREVREKSTGGRGRG